MTDEFPPSGRPVPKWPAYARACACALALAFSSAARAEVIEISANGEVARFAGPATITTEGVTPIEAPRASARTAAATAISADLQRAGDSVALNDRLIEAVAWAESRFNQSARSPDGAIGIMQLMPGTAADLGVDATDARENVRGGATYLRQMLDRFDGDIVLALAAYNAGPGAVERHGGVPPYPETQAYVAAVLGYLAISAEEEIP
jgi:soluble lytic murein transglycosylase-like protein